MTLIYRNTNSHCLKITKKFSLKFAKIIFLLFARNVVKWDLPFVYEKIILTKKFVKTQRFCRTWLLTTLVSRKICGICGLWNLTSNNRCIVLNMENWVALQRFQIEFFLSNFVFDWNWKFLTFFAKVRLAILNLSSIKK